MTNKQDNFDLELINRAGGLTLPEAEITRPWKVPISCITWGLILTFVHLNFLYLQFILPTIGAALIFFGFRSLRYENKYFLIAFVFSIIKLALQLCHLVITSAPLNTQLDIVLLSAVAAVLEVALFVLFHMAIHAVYKRAKHPLNNKSLLCAAVWTVAALLLALSPYAQGLVPLIMIVIYIVIARGIFRIGTKLDDTGYQLKPTKVRISNHTLGLIYGLICLFSVVICCLFSNHIPSDGTPYSPLEASTLTEQLTALGFPADALSFLSEEDLLPLKDAVNIEAVSSTLPFGTINDTSELETPLQASNVLHVNTVYIELPKNVMYVMQQFEWEGANPVWQDGVQVTPDSLGIDLKIVSSGLYYTKNQTDYKADFARLDDGLFMQSSMFGEHEAKQIIGTFSYPFFSSKQGGYILYRYSLPSDYELFSTVSILNYLHQSFPLELPYQDPKTKFLQSQFQVFDERQQHYTNYDSKPQQQVLPPLPD